MATRGRRKMDKLRANRERRVTRGALKHARKMLRLAQRSNRLASQD